jgi:hypothetical protein
MGSQGESTSRYRISNGKPVWLLLLLALAVPTIYAFVGIVLMKGQLNAQEKDIRENSAAIDLTPRTYVPRTEIDAKLETIQVQIGSVQANVDGLKDQGERQTAEIIRRIERIDSPRRVQ